MLTTLINALDAYIKICKQEKDKTAKRIVGERAFGTCQYHVLMFPSDRRRVGNLWEDVYKPQFENIIQK